MAMLRPASEMKDSGYEYIGNIPANWKICKVRHIGSPQNGISFGGDAYGEGYPFVSYGDVYRNFSLPKQVKGLIQSYDADRKRYSVQKGDIFFTRTSETKEEIGFSCVCEESIPDAVFAGFLIRIRPFNNKIDTGFAKYYFRSHHLRAYFVKEMNLIIRASLGQELLKGAPVLLPPKDEQQAIADYLDDRCSKIDEIIAEATASIEEYKELKQAVIFEAVTKGLDKTVPMKDSGVEWIGNIPNNWYVLGFTKAISSIVDYRGKTPEKVDTGVFLVTAKNIKDGVIDYTVSKEYVRTEKYNEIMHRGIPEIGDVLFTTEAPLGKVANVDRIDIALAQRIIKFRSDEAILDNYFLKYWIISKGFQENLSTFATGSIATGIKASKLGMLKVIIPPLNEQKKIVNYLNLQCNNIDSVIVEKQALIEDLQAYKKSLIYEVVTGKRRVV